MTEVPGLVSTIGKWTFRVRDCPLCGSPWKTPFAILVAEDFCSANSTYRRDFDEILEIDRHAEFPIAECSSCAFHYAGLLPPKDFLDLVYESVIDEGSVACEAADGRWVAHLLGLVGILVEQTAALSDAVGNRRVLDFGCGEGTALSALRLCGHEAVGVEPSPSRRAIAGAHGFTIAADLADGRRHSPFVGVLLSDVLEHVPDPMATLKALADLLVEGGIVLVSVPLFGRRRIRDLALGLMRHRSDARILNPWEHLNCFSVKSLRLAIVRAGFDARPAADSVNIGLRPGLVGSRRLGNIVASMRRLLGYLLTGESVDSAWLGICRK